MSTITKHVLYGNTQLRLYALIHDKSDGKEYEVFVRIHEQKVNVKEEPATKEDVYSIRGEIMNTRSALTSAIYFTAMAQSFLIAFCCLCILIVQLCK